MKTILVHLNDHRRAESLLAPVVAIARRHTSHVVGFHTYTGLPPVAAVAVPYGASVLDSVVQADRREAEALEQMFRAATAGSAVSTEWISARSPHPDLAAFVMQHGRAADLIVASQSDPDWDFAPILDFPERLAMESGRPVLVVPALGSFRAGGRSIAIAWDGSREAARAAFDALPLLAAAESVVLLIVDDGHADPENVRAAADMVAAFARHGVTIAVRRLARDTAGVGDTLLAAAADAGADMLVMGAYGHSRFREFVFGGATRHVLRHMTMPTLLSH